MVQVTGVLVEMVDGSTRTYAQGRKVDTDGFGDYVIRNGNGDMLATRKRASVESVEVMYGDEPAEG